ncbi:MAG: hypothetical protein PVF58_04295 [Candidatus Methanofastidiosia archaeon]|jgi:hypothetical protein
MKWFLVLFIFSLLFMSQVNSQKEQPDSQTLTVKVVEGTLFVEYTLVTGVHMLKEGETLDITAHISWVTEKEKNTDLSVIMKGTPYTESELSDVVKTSLTFDESSGAHTSEVISGFWEYWFGTVIDYGFFSEYSQKVIHNWNEAEIKLHQDFKGSIYSLKATYYDFFTKFYPTPEDFFAEREVDFQLIFGIHNIAPQTPLSIMVELPEEVEVIKFEPSSFSQLANTFTLYMEPGEKIPNARVRFKTGGYVGTELPQLIGSKEVSCPVITVNESIVIVITVENTSSVEAAHVKIEDEISEKFKIIEGNPVLYIEALKGGQKVIHIYTVTPLHPGDFILKGTEITFQDQFGKSYTVYTEDIAVTVSEKSGGSTIVVVAAMIYILVLRRGYNT